MRYDGRVVWQRLVTILLLIQPFCGFGQEKPLGLYLTWEEDPTSTMVIDWHSPFDQALDTLFFRQQGSQLWKRRLPTASPFPHSVKRINRVKLSGLGANTTYEFRIGRFHRIYRFETMPQDIDTNPIVFAIGGDTYDRGHSARHRWMENMNRIVMRYNPKFIVWGGDLAYADGKPDQAWRWEGWFDAIQNTLIQADGKIIPIIVCIGNHEVRHQFPSWSQSEIPLSQQREAVAPYFYKLFAFPGQPGYKALDFGQYLSLIILDSDHTNSVAGDQQRWLKKQLRLRKRRSHVFPVYHVPAYPSTKSDIHSGTSQAVKTYWTPLFDRYKVRWAFEFHDHAYKRTHPIKGGEIHPLGTRYFGDGGWGTQVRTPKHPDTSWYLEKSVRARHGMIVSLYQDQRHIKAVDEFGQVIDQYPHLFSVPNRANQSSPQLWSAGQWSISAEQMEVEGQVFLESDVAGFSGQGFAMFVNKDSLARVSWPMDIEEAVQLTIKVRYSNVGNSRQAQLFLNSLDQPIGRLRFKNTQEESQWIWSESIEIPIEKGENKIGLSLKQGLGVRVDQMMIHWE